MKKTLKHNLVLILFVTLWLMGLLIRYVAGEQSFLWNLWSTVDVAFAVALGVMAFLAYREFIKSEDEVKIYFKVEGKRYDTGLSLLRKDCTRGEILGVLGMMQRTTKERFSFDSKELSILLKEVQEVQKGVKDNFELSMSRDELEQFVI
jgi:hypothetical protein